MKNPVKKNLFDLETLGMTDLLEDSDSIFEEVDSRKDGEKYITFLLGETHFALPSNAVSEVVRSLPSTSLPNLPNWFVGIANLRGDIISIIDLLMLWNEGSIESAKSKLIVLQSNDCGSQIAFKVDKFCEIITLPSKQLQESQIAANPQIFGKLLHKSVEITLLSIEKLLLSIKIT